MKFRVIISSFCFLLILTGCANHYISANELDVIELGMNKSQLASKLGQGIRRGAIKNKFSQNIEVWEYKVKEGVSGRQLGAQIGLTVLTFGITAPLIGDGETNRYWLYFCDGELVRWGQAGDWEDAQKKIYDINFNVNNH
ncbi:MAG: hypothetical protein K940chlam8_00331 [Chlamydiae bacterium]|nr:hypothetical protein [Chlamydiota bacterium]